ncbi:AsmA family protein [Radicibacter daui]|uniref:AsmA family protein n=1 Tax=Radicibacter daui TaxID=3064829 RepID=UPI004046A16F
MIKNLLLAFVVLIALALGAALIIPGFVDWSSYRDTLAQQLSAATGRQVSLDGELRFSFLPSPVLYVSNAHIANPEGAAEQDFLSLDTLEVKLAMAPLFSGRIEVESVTLVSPRLVLEVLADGQVSWQMGQRSLPGMQIRDVTISNGTLIWRDQRQGVERRLEKINMRIAAQSLEGPLTAKGTMTAYGVTPHPLDLLVDMGAAHRATTGVWPIRLRTQVKDEQGNIAGDFSYQGLFFPKGDTLLQGELRGQGGSLADLLALTGAEDLPAPVAGNFQGRGQLAVTASGIETNNVEFSLGDAMRATGAVSYGFGDVPRLDVALALSRVEVAPWLDWKSGVPLPSGLTGSLDLSVEAAEWRDAPMRDVHFGASFAADGSLAVERASALLPGGAQFQLAGTVKPGGDGLQGDLQLTANADDLRTTLTWLGYDAGAVPADRLRKLDLSTHLTGTPDHFTAGDINLGLDTGRLTGALTYAAAAGEGGRPGIGARLDADRINLDAYFPVPAGEAKGSALLVLPQRLGDLAGLADMNVSARIGELAAGGVNYDGVHLDATLSQGALALRDFSASDVSGSALTLAGRVGGLKPLSGLDLTLAVKAADAAPLLRSFGFDPGAKSRAFADVDAKLTVAGEHDALQLGLSGHGGGFSAEAAGSVSNLSSRPAYAFKARVKQASFANALALLLPATRLPDDLGDLDLYAEGKGGDGKLQLSGIQGQVGGIPVVGNLAVDTNKDRPVVTADLQTGDILVDRFLAGPPRVAALPLPGGSAAWSDAALDWSLLHAIDGTFKLKLRGLTWGAFDLGNATVEAALEDGALTVSSLNGDAFRGKLSGSGRVTAAPGGQGGEVKAALTLKGGGLGAVLEDGKITPVGEGLLDYSFDVSASGASRNALISSLTGSGDFALTSGQLAGIDLNAVAAAAVKIGNPGGPEALAKAAQAGGKTPFSSFKGSFTLEGGVARLDDVALSLPAGSGKLTGTVNLPQWQVVLAGPFSITNAAVPPARIGVSGPLDNLLPAVDVSDIVSRANADAAARAAAEKAAADKAAAEKAAAEKAAAEQAAAEKAAAEKAAAEKAAADAAAAQAAAEKAAAEKAAAEKAAAEKAAAEKAAAEKAAADKAAADKAAAEKAAAEKARQQQPSTQQFINDILKSLGGGTGG